MFTVTTDWIDKHRTPAGAYMSAQTNILHLADPKVSGWIKRAHGLKITEEQKKEFESYHYGYKATKRSLVVIRQHNANDAEIQQYRKSLMKQESLLTEPTQPIISKTHRFEGRGCACNVLPWDDCPCSRAQAS